MVSARSGRASIRCDNEAPVVRSLGSVSSELKGQYREIAGKFGVPRTERSSIFRGVNRGPPISRHSQRQVLREPLLQALLKLHRLPLGGHGCPRGAVAEEGLLPRSTGRPGSGWGGCSYASRFGCAEAIGVCSGPWGATWEPYDPPHMERLSRSGQSDFPTHPKLLPWNGPGGYHPDMMSSPWPLRYPVTAMNSSRFCFALVFVRVLMTLYMTSELT